MTHPTTRQMASELEYTCEEEIQQRLTEALASKDPDQAVYALWDEIFGQDPEPTEEI